MKKIMTLCLLSMIASCGQDSTDPVSKNVNEELEVLNSEGTYKAIIRPINTSLSGWIPSGIASINILGDEIEVQTWLEDAASTIHHQNIHIGTECPIMNDKNNDGLIDVREMIPSTKEILIPLDDQLDSLAIGLGSYPIGKSYQYFQKGSVSKINSELAQSSLKIKSLNLNGKIIMIHGASPTKELASSIASVDGKSAQETIPIACGIIEKIETDEEGPQ